MNVKSVTFGPDMVRLGTRAFMGTNIQVLDFRYDGVNVSEVGASSTFQNCEKLEALLLPDSIATGGGPNFAYNTFVGAAQLVCYVGPDVNGDGSGWSLPGLGVVPPCPPSYCQDVVEGKTCAAAGAVTKLTESDSEGAEPKKACSDECIAHAEAVNATGCCSYQYVPYHTAAGAPKQSYLCLFYPGGSAAPLPAASAALSSRHSASMCG